MRKREEIQEVPRRLKQFIEKLTLYVDRPWYVPLMGFLVFIDLFVGFIPSEAVLVKTVLLKPRSWVLITVVLISSSALGAVTLGYLAHTYGEPFLHWLAGDILHSDEWKWAHDFIERHGPWAMALISLSPLPQQPAVAACGLAGMPLMTLFSAVWLGRAPKYFGFAYLATKAPHLYEKYLKKILEDEEPSSPGSPPK